jgi:hypothetical protein
VLLTNKFVMPGLVPGIHVLATCKEDVDGRVKPGHDGGAMDTVLTNYCVCDCDCPGRPPACSTLTATVSVSVPPP